MQNPTPKMGYLVNIWVSDMIGRLSECKNIRFLMNIFILVAKYALHGLLLTQKGSFTLFSG